MIAKQAFFCLKWNSACYMGRALAREKGFHIKKKKSDDLDCTVHSIECVNQQKT